MKTFHSYLHEGATEASYLRDKLVAAVTAYDRRRANKPGFNHYALSMYLNSVDNAVNAIGAGTPVEAALRDQFIEPLLTAVLKAAGLR
jgi:hypothetical protein